MRTLRRVGRVGNAPPLMASRSTSHISASTIAAAANTVANADESSTGRSVGQSTLTHSGKRNSSALPSHYRRQSSDTRGGETGRSISHSSRASGLQTEGILREGLCLCYASHDKSLTWTFPGLHYSVQLLKARHALLSHCILTSEHFLC